MFGQAFQYQRREDNRVKRALQIILVVADGREGQYTEGEGDGSRKKLKGGTGFKIIH